MNAMSAFGGKDPLLGIKSIDYYPVLVFITLGRGTLMCNWTRTPIVERKGNYWHLLEVARLRFDFF